MRNEFLYTATWLGAFVVLCMLVAFMWNRAPLQPKALPLDLRQRAIEYNACEAACAHAGRAP